jgi:hypothetical protein
VPGPSEIVPEQLDTGDPVTIGEKVAIGTVVPQHVPVVK